MGLDDRQVALGYEPVAVAGAHEQQASGECARTQRSQQVPRAIEVDVELALRLAKRFADARQPGEVKDGIRTDIANVGMQCRRAYVETIGQRGDAPLCRVPVCIQHALHRAADEAGVAGDEELSHSGR